MKAGWEVKALGAVIQIRPQKREARERLAFDEAVSFVPMEDLGELQRSFEPRHERPLSEVYSGYTYFAEGDVLLAKITPCFENGKLSVASNLKNGVGFGSSEFMVLRCSERIVPEYLFYFLSRDEFRETGKGRMTGAVGHKRVPPEYVQSQRLPLPPLEEQQRIVAVLDEAFEGLARARARTEANLRNARELFDSFLAAEFSKNISDWQVGELNDHVQFVDYRGKTPPKAEHGIRLITAKNVKMGYINREPEEFIHEGAYDAWMTRGFPEIGDVLFTTEAPLANVAQLDTDETVVIGQRLITMKADPEVLVADFLKFALMSPPMQSEIHGRGTGATVVGIKASLLKTVPLAYPREISVQRKIALRCQRVYDDVVAMETGYNSKLEDLDDLRQSLLRRAFAGELT